MANYGSGKTTLLLWGWFDHTHNDGAVTFSSQLWGENIRYRGETFFLLLLFYMMVNL